MQGMRDLRIGDYVRAEALGRSAEGQVNAVDYAKRIYRVSNFWFGQPSVARKHNMILTDTEKEFVLEYPSYVIIMLGDGSSARGQVKACTCPITALWNGFGHNAGCPEANHG